MHARHLSGVRRETASAARFDATPRRALAVLAAFAVGVLAAGGLLGACEDPGGGGGAGSTSAGGAGGCPMAPEAMFTIRVHNPGGSVPPDTTIRIAWSAGEEPAFALDDPHTWKTLDEANLVCTVDRAAPPPDDLSVLVCQLWTTGATRVQIAARGYEDVDETLTPMENEACESFIPSEIDIALVALVEDDGGNQ